MKRNRFAVLALAWAMLAFSLTACGGGKSVEGGQQPESAPGGETVQEAAFPDDGGVLLDNDGMEEDYADAPVVDAAEIGRGGEDVPLSETPADPYAGLDEEEAAQIQEVLRLVNMERAEAGLYPLVPDAGLMRAAKVRARECVELFSHTRPNDTPYKTAIQEAGVACTAMGENVATGYDSAEKAMTGWMNSEGHKANILRDKFTRIGIGLAPNTGNKYSGYAWAQEFANG